MRRSIAALLAPSVLSIAVVTATPASAIVGGAVDTANRYPAVGTVGVVYPDGQTQMLTGFLVSPTVVVTWAQASIYFAGAGGTPAVWFSDGGGVPKRYAVARIETHPGFNPTNYANDVGVFILAKPIRTITPFSLPTLDLLDQMQRGNALADQTFMTVGFGADTVACSTGWCAYDGFGVKRFTTGSLLAVGDGDLWFLANATATGQGAACVGDWGGPHLLGSTNVAVGLTAFITSGEHMGCSSIYGAQRLDTASVRRFLGGFMTLP